MKFLSVPFSKPCACRSGIVLYSKKEATVKDGVQEIAVVVYCEKCGKKYQMGKAEEVEAE